jgi:flagellar hook-associated protein 2
MDIDELVKSMMQAERVPLDKLTQKKQYSEWQRDDYRSMNTALSELDTLIRDGIGKQSSFIKKKVTVSNPDAVSVKNVNSTSDFSGNIKVNGLAKAAYYDTGHQ